MKRTREPYVDWLAFTRQTDSQALRGCMMDLHWFVNNGGPRESLRDLSRLAYYCWRWLRSPPVKPLSESSLLFVIDTPGVGGLLTLYPLLKAKPATMRITVAVTDFIHKDRGFSTLVDADASIDVLNVDRLRGRFRLDRELCGATFAIARRFKRLLPTVPLFLTRCHAYAAVAEGMLAFRPDTRVVVFNERMLLSACFSEAARRHAVHVTAIQHGNFVDNYLPVLVNRYLTWGEFHSQWLVQRAKCETLAIGSPRLDVFPPPGGPQHDPQPGLPRDRPIHVVFFSQVGSATASPRMIATTRREILRLTANPSFRLSIKMHPLDCRANWDAEGELAHRAAYLEGQVTLQGALHDADVVCSFYSSVLAEALLWECAVIQLNPFPQTVGFFPSPTGIPSVQNCADLVSHMVNLRDNPGRLQAAIAHQRRLRDGYFANLGKAGAAFWASLPSAMQPQDEDLAGRLHADPLGR